MSVLAERIVLLHRSLRRAGIPHAFGGALALAYCTEQARGTLDIDINVFLDADDLRRLEGALPEGVRITPAIRKLLVAEGQARVLWDRIPVDVFLNTTPFHTLVAGRIAWHRFGRLQLPFLTCSDLAVFKAFFSRAKDWVDLEEMQRAGVLDIESVCTVLAEYLGPTDERIDRLRSLGD